MNLLKSLAIGIVFGFTWLVLDVVVWKFGGGDLDTRAFTAFIASTGGAFVRGIIA